jgi:hypothetical protein
VPTVPEAVRRRHRRQLRRWDPNRQQGLAQGRKRPDAPDFMGREVDEVSIIVNNYKHVIHKIELDQLLWDGTRYAYRTS